MDPNLPSASNPQAGQPQAYAGQPPPYASAPPPYAPQCTGQIPQYSAQAPQYPGQTPQYPSQAPQYPGQAPQYPGQNPYIQGQVPQYPVQAPQYPGHASQYAAPGPQSAGPQYLAQAPQHPAQGPQYPAQPQYPGQVPQHPGQAPMQVPLVVQTQAVYGLNIANVELATLTRKVLNLSVAAMVVYCIGAAVQFTTLVSIEDNHGFDFGQFYGGVLAALVLGLAINLIVPCCGYFGAKNNNKDVLCCFCGCNGIMAVLQLWSLIGYASSFSTISIPLSIVTLILQCSSFHYGRNLHDKLRNGAVIHMAPAPVYFQTAVQPV